MTGCATTGDFGFGRSGMASHASIHLTPDMAVTRNVLKNRLLITPDRMPGPYAGPVLAFYTARDFAPAWTGSGETEAMGQQVKAVLRRAHEQGLRDADYRGPWDKQTAAGPAPGEDAARYEIALTTMFVSYVHDVRLGRVRPLSVYDALDIGLPTQRFDVATELEKAIEAGTLTQFLADLPPPHPEYKKLVEALARYRAIDDRGGWPVLPEPKSGIRLDIKDKRIPLLIERLAAEDPEAAKLDHPSTEELREAVKRFQARVGLDADGHVGAETFAALNIPASERMAEIAANMERWRWLPRDFEDRYIAINVPDQSLKYVHDGDVALSSKVVVGRKAYPTPITRTAITAVVANPPWNIPGFIAARDLLPKLRRDPNYLATRNMVIMGAPADDPHGRKIDWHKIEAATFPYAIRQLPGPFTALGQVMLDSPNDFDVYLHDTPNKKLFDLDDREVSNGCVRVQKIFPLASLALTGDAEEGMERLTSLTNAQMHETQRLELEKPLPVYFLYWTAFSGPDGALEFRPDVYDRDPVLIAALAPASKAVPLPKAKPSLSAAASGPEEEDLSP